MRNRGARPVILGHRGYRARFPENTLLAFREALTAGADGIECDIQKTVDGRYVVIHDPHTGRVAASRRDVAVTPYAELRSLDVGSQERIPLLEELLGMLPADAYLDLELKEETIVAADCARIGEILDAVRDRSALMISSFHAPLLTWFRKHGFTVGYLIGEETAIHGTAAFVGTLLRLRPQYLNLPREVFERLGERRARLLLRFLRLLGFSLLFWTVNTPAAALPLLPHARIIVTDEVEALVRMRED